MPTSTPPFRFRSPVCRRFFAAYHGSMPHPLGRPAGERRGKTAQLGMRTYDAENDLRASRTVRYWRWLMGTASSQSMTSPSAEAWTTCSMFAR